MLRYILITVIALFLLPVKPTNAQVSSCSNSDFELNSFAGWTGTTGSCCPINSTTPGIVNGRHTIMTGGTDVNTNNVLSCVAPGGSYSVRLGNDNTNSEAEQLSYSFVVTPQTQLFVYRYAVVLQDPGHPIADQPRFEIKVRDQNGNMDSICGFYSVYAAAGIPGFVTITDPFDPSSLIHFKDWTTVGIDLSSKMGSTITIEFSTGDCAQGAHYGYAYIDCMCYPFNVLADFCPGSFTATLSAPPGFASYQWSTGETTQNINIVNPLLGDTFNVVMTSVTGCQVSLNSIIRESIVASAYTLADSCFNNTLFLDSSYVITGTPINSWQWDFGDGTFSTLSSPTHTYTNPGIYNVSLIVTNQGGCTDTIGQVVKVLDIPNPGFSAVPVCPGTPMPFTDSSTVAAPSNIISWTWDFGDGTSGDTTQDPSHIYNLPGTYQVQLVAEDNAGCRDTVTLPVSTVAGPITGFTYATACATPDVQFTDTTFITGGAITTWTWDFGDASGTSNLQHPFHTYPGPGTYTVQLITVVNGTCTDTASMQITLQNLPTASFSTSNACVQSGASFADLSFLAGSSIVNWRWDFGDGSAVDTNQNPVHIYNTAGNYQVSLTATATNGCSGVAIDTITILPSPTADFEFGQVCPGQSGSFVDSSSFISGALSWSWDFGDGGTLSSLQNPQHIYSTGGVYWAQLAIKDNNGCTDTLLRQIITAIAPVSQFATPTGCKNDVIAFLSTSGIATGTVDTTIWNFGDGSAEARAIQTSHIYTAPGNYNVTLTTISNAGCSDAVIHEVYIRDLPVANFTSPPVCLGDTSFFTDLTQPVPDSINNWHWNFGDGVTSASKNPWHVYTADSTQSIMLVVTDAFGCKDTGTRAIYIRPLPIPDFVSAGTYCAFDPVNFTQQVTAFTGIRNLLWEFTFNSGISTVHNPAYTFPAGAWNIMLHATDSTGCSDSLSKVVVIHSLPVTNFVTGNECIYNAVSFQSNATVIGSTITTHAWDFGDAVKDSSATTSHIYSSPATYTATLTATAATGCFNDTTFAVTVHPQPQALFAIPSVCELQPVQFNNGSSVSSGSIIAWNWDFGDGSLDDITENPVHTFPANNTYDVTLVVWSDSLCMDTLTRQLTVSPQPVASFAADTVCYGLPTHFANQSTVASGNIAYSLWDFNSSASDTAMNPEYVAPSPGVYPATLTAVTNAGCSDTITIPVRVYELPVAALTADARDGCMPLDVQFTNNSISNDGTIIQWYWTFGDGGIDTLEHPAYQYADAGTYDVTLSVITDLQCNDSVAETAYINVYPLPVAGFSFTPEHPDLIHPNVNFHDESTGASAWYYDFGDLFNDVVASPQHTYQQSGSYTVMQEVTTDFGCVDTAWRTVEVAGVFTLYIPNAFTPNSDGKNDMFYAYGEGINEFNMKIFNRWGQPVFESSELMKGWNGDAGNNTAVEDVYYYVAKVTDIFDNEHIYKGKVTVVY